MQPFKSVATALCRMQAIFLGWQASRPRMGLRSTAWTMDERTRASRSLPPVQLPSLRLALSKRLRHPVLNQSCLWLRTERLRLKSSSDPLREPKSPTGPPPTPLVAQLPNVQPQWRWSVVPLLPPAPLRPSTPMEIGLAVHRRLSQGRPLRHHKSNHALRRHHSRTLPPQSTNQLLLPALFRLLCAQLPQGRRPHHLMQTSHSVPSLYSQHRPTGKAAPSLPPHLAPYPSNVKLCLPLGLQCCQAQLPPPRRVCRRSPPLSLRHRPPLANQGLPQLKPPSQLPSA